MSVPPDWSFDEDEELVTLEPPGRRAAVQLSSRRRAGPGRPAESGEAAGLVIDAAGGRGRRIEPDEHRTNDVLAASATYEEGSDAGTRWWFVGVKVSPIRMVLFTYNDDTTETALRDTASAMFEGVHISAS